MSGLDYPHHEWHYKPVGFVGYGGVSAGTRVVQMLKQVVTTLTMVPLFEAVSSPFVTQFLDQQGRVRPNEVMDSAAARCSPSWSGSPPRCAVCAPPADHAG